MSIRSGRSLIYKFNLFQASGLTEVIPLPGGVGVGKSRGSGCKVSVGQANIQRSSESASDNPCNIIRSSKGIVVNTRNTKPDQLLRLHRRPFNPCLPRFTVRFTLLYRREKIIRNINVECLRKQVYVIEGGDGLDPGNDRNIDTHI